MLSRGLPHGRNAAARRCFEECWRTAELRKNLQRQRNGSRIDHEGHGIQVSEVVLELLGTIPRVQRGDDGPDTKSAIKRGDEGRGVREQESHADTWLTDQRSENSRDGMRPFEQPTKGQRTIALEDRDSIPGPSGDAIKVVGYCIASSHCRPAGWSSFGRIS